MTRSVVTPRIAYSGSGGTGPFSVPFYFADNTHISVYLIDSSSVSTLLVEGTGYTLTGAGTGSGSITTTDTVDTGEELVIYRTTPLDQDTDFPANGTYSSANTEATFDKLVDLVQDLKAKTDFFLLPLSGKAPTDSTLRDKYLKLNSTGTALEAAEGVDVSAFVPGMNCLVVATSNITLSGTQTIDGVGVAVGNIVLVTGQTTKSQNGVYVVASGAWTRHTDHDDTAGLQAMTAFGVTSGTSYANTIWVCLTLDPVVGTDDIYISRLAADLTTATLNISNGGSINFNSGDVLLTHSANAIAMTGGALSITYNGAATSEPLRLVNSTDNASVQVLQLEGDRATMADNDEAYVSLLLSNDAGTQTEFGRLTWVATDVNAGTSVDGRLDFAVVTAGTLADEMQLDGTALSPSTNDGLALGTSSLMWSDFFLASGSIINWNNGDATLTHSANLLALAGAALTTSHNGAATTAPVSTTNTTDNASVKALTVAGDRATMANNDIAYLSMELSNASGTQVEYGRLGWRADDVTAGSEDASLLLGTMTAGSFAYEVVLSGTAFAPFTSDGNALGTSALMWSDLFLASGAVVNFNNGDVLLTHSADALAMTGGALSVAHNGAAATAPFTTTNTTDNASVKAATFAGDRATPANNDLGYLEFQMSNAVGTQKEVARLAWKMDDVANGSEDAHLRFSLIEAGALTDELQLTLTSLNPLTNDGLALGTSSLMWSDLFLASGSVIDFNNGDVTLTHSSNTLTLAGGDLVVPNASADGHALNRVTGDGRYLAPGSVGISTTNIAYLGAMGAPINCSITSSVASNILTISLKDATGNAPSSTNRVLLPFRSSTLTSGAFTYQEVTAPTTLAVPDTATLGTSNNTPFKLHIGIVNDAGTMRLTVVNCLSGVDVFRLEPNMIISSTTINTSADSAQVFYSDAGVTSKAFLYLGYLEWSSGLATAGTWSSDASYKASYTVGMKLPGDVIQTATSIDGAVATGTTTIPFDDTIPQNTEGDQYMSQAITPTSTANILVIEHLGVYASSAASGVDMIAAIFQDATANAIASATSARNPSAGSPAQISVLHRMRAGTTSSTTFKVRAGQQNAGTTTFNGSAGARLFGGTLNSVLKVTELVG